MSKENKSSKSPKAKINRAGALELVMKRMVEIRESDAANSVKANSERRLGKSAITTLVGRSSRSDENRAAITTINREITRLRTAIKDAGFIRHDFNDKIKSAADKHPLVAEQLLKLVGITYKDAAQLISETLSEIKKRERLTKNKENKGQLKSAHKALSSIKFEPVIFMTLIRSKEQRDELAKIKESRIESYLRDPREIDYSDIYKLMGELINSKKDWAKLALGLAIASGRRMIEIINKEAATFEPTSRQLECVFTSDIKKKETESNKIPLLVSFDVFKDALDRLHNHERIKSLVESLGDEVSRDKINSAINANLDWSLNSTASQYSKYGIERFKDSRAIYARLARAEYEINCKNGSRKPIGEELFFKEALAHTDLDTQINYKQFILVGVENVGFRKVKSIKTKSVAEGERDRLAELKDIAESEEVKTSAAFARYADFVIAQVEKDPSFKISAASIKTELGGNKGIICKFVKLIKEADLIKPL